MTDAHKPKQSTPDSVPLDSRDSSKPKETVEQNTKEPKQGAFANVSRSLSDNDLKNPAVVRMLMDKVDSLESEKVQLEAYREKYHEADKQNAVSAQTIADLKKFQILHSLCTGIGGILMGTAFSITGTELKVIMFLVGALFIIVGEFSAWSGRK